MKNKEILFLVCANLVLLLALTFLLPQHMVAPGKLMEAHRALETDCFACHTPFLGARPARCTQCHKPAEIGLVTTKGVPIGNEQKLVPFHQYLVEQDCVACHSDHKGVQAFHPIARFSHGLLQAGVGEQCGGCHRRPGDDLHRQVSRNCAQCHSRDAWTPASFDHDRFFLLTGDHQATCNTCHESGDYSRYTCYGCHEHSRSGIREKHLEEGIVRYEACVECHRSGEEDGEAGEREGARRFDGSGPLMGSPADSVDGGRSGAQEDDEDDEDEE